MKDPMIQNAYDLEILKTSAQAGLPGGHGWVFGLPPGIKPEQWPLDPWNGYPLMHGFTLLLPEDYRVHGPDIVALSFFATAPDHNDGGPEEGHEDLFDLITEPGEDPPEDAQLLPFWTRARQVHPRTHRMQDELDCAYAVVLLTQAEFDGAACLPMLVGSEYLDDVDAPQWLALGSAASYWEEMYSPALQQPMEDYAFIKTVGQVPVQELGFQRAIRWTQRADPNAGKTPQEFEGSGQAPADGGYQSAHYWEGGVVDSDNYRQHDWAKSVAVNHIGGTMKPVQSVPEMSPFYIEFGEDFGGYNFGGGVAQLDFRDMKFDWAC